jgi:CRISPR-associated protein Cas1
MIKKTLYFGNPAYLSKRNEQLVIKLPEVVKNDSLPDTFKQQSEVTIPIEDIGVIVLDHQQITVTHGLLESLLNNNTAVITCDSSRMPAGLMLPLSGNTTQRERWHDQIEASVPLKKQLWQQTIKTKIANQTALLQQRCKVNTKNMLYWADEVKSGDSENHEARAAAYYWGNIFPTLPDFRRGREEEPPNNLLNYGYAILRAVVARSLVSSGLLPTFGIHHRNRYNAYCLADDVMEPYRPYVDKLVCDIVDSGCNYTELTKELKQQLLQIPTFDVVIDGERSPLMVGVQRTTASLYKCFSGELRKIAYPSFG